MGGHKVGGGSGVEPVAHPFGVCEPVVCERRISPVEGDPQRVEAGGACGIPILVPGQLHRQTHMRQRVGGRVRDHRVEMLQRCLGPLDLGEDVSKLHMRVEQAVGNQDRALPRRGEQAVVHHPFRVGVEVSGHAFRLREQCVNPADRRFLDLDRLVRLP